MEAIYNELFQLVNSDNQEENTTSYQSVPFALDTLKRKKMEKKEDTGRLLIFPSVAR